MNKKSKRSKRDLIFFETSTIILTIQCCLSADWCDSSNTWARLDIFLCSAIFSVILLTWNFSFVWEFQSSWHLSCQVIQIVFLRNTTIADNCNKALYPCYRTKISANNEHFTIWFLGDSFSPEFHLGEWINKIRANY